MFRSALTVSLATTLCLTAAAADSPTTVSRFCSTRADVLRHLAHKYSENPVAVGLAENGGIMELLTSAEGGTWTLIITMPNGVSCMVAAGEDWEELPAVLAKDHGA